MKLRLQLREDSILVTRLDMGVGGFMGAAAGASFEIKPGQTYMTHPYRRLKRWCDKHGGSWEGECADGIALPADVVQEDAGYGE